MTELGLFLSRKSVNRSDVARKTGISKTSQYFKIVQNRSIHFHYYYYYYLFEKVSTPFVVDTTYVPTKDNDGTKVKGSLRPNARGKTKFYTPVSGGTELIEMAVLAWTCQNGQFTNQM
ncbi:hypothetical protein [Flavivirga jejuensis]|uniref:DDE superfamily endonuclease n=1 Tax=Flavivirga jejuensis TaxID=870487 RepID=A0ABT8WSG3_9FLAO|nr:hypothetical protein [Flavivirga jejuensis]MDO5976110.1 hypothetical protein [Flavivirga jejuensis]